MSYNLILGIAGGQRWRWWDLQNTESQVVNLKGKGPLYSPTEYSVFKTGSI